MDPRSEQELRTRAADLVLDWHTGGTPETLEQASPDTYASLIEAAHVAHDETGASLRRWVDAGRRAGLSWTDVGGAIGVSRQAAQQRFAHDGAIGEIRTDDTDRVVRTGVNAFNEVAILREEGRAGRRVVGATWFTLFFEQTADPHENIRVVSLRGSTVRDRHERDGWTHALTWYPYHYFTRPIQAGDAD